VAAARIGSEDTRGRAGPVTAPVHSHCQSVDSDMGTTVASVDLHFAVDAPRARWDGRGRIVALTAIT